MGKSEAESIGCSHCGEESFLKREPVYDGFAKSGEKLSCAGCGHVFENEADVPFKGRGGPSVFTDADRSADVDVFAKDEKGQICRYCTNYVVNPFTQRCSLHFKVVDATDTCPNFEEKKED